MEWIDHAWPWLVKQLQDPKSAAATLISLLASAGVAGAVRGFFAAKADTARMLAAGKQPKMDDEPTGKHRLPSPFETDTALERHYRETVHRLSRDLEASQAEARALRLARREDADEVTRLRGVLEARTYSLARSQAHALQLRKELARALGVREDHPSIPPAPRTPGSQRGLEPVTDPPPRQLDELRDTPPSGLQGVRAPRS